MGIQYIPREVMNSHGNSILPLGCNGPLAFYWLKATAACSWVQYFLVLAPIFAAVFRA